MLTESKLVWVAQYVLGIVLLLAVMPFIIDPQPEWSAAHGWAFLLFIVCSGITLLGTASATRQFMNLADRVEKLEQMADDLKHSADQENSGHTRGQKAERQYVCSEN